MSRLGRGCIVLGVCFLGVASEGAARAEPDAQTRSAAIVLFDEARKLMADGKYAVACPKLEQSQKMDPGVGILLNLADCYEHVGRTASAWLTFRDAAGAARSAGQAEREKVARDRAAALEPRLTRLLVSVSAGAPAGLEVTRDGATVPRELWGTSLPTDPGEHAMRASAAGFTPWESKVQVKGEGSVVTINVPALAPARSAPGAAVVPPVQPPAGSPPSGSPPPVEPARSPDGAWRGPVGLVVAGLGVAGMGVGTAFGFMAKSTFDDAAPHCDDANRCDQTGVDLREDAVGKGNVGTVIFIAGAALAAGGAVLWLTAPSSSQGHGEGASARLGCSPGGVVVQGAF